MYSDMLYKIRQWDNRAAQWMGRHFYIILFEVLLVIIFIFAFINAFKIINASFAVHRDSVAEQLLLNLAINTTLIVMLLILISLGVLNIINNNSRLRGTIKNIEYNLSRRRTDHKPTDD